MLDIMGGSEYVVFWWLGEYTKASTQSLRKIFISVYLLPAVQVAEERCVQYFLGGNLRGKKQLGRPRQKWEDNTKSVFQTQGKGRMAWIDLALDIQDAYSCECGNEHQGSIKWGEFLDSLWTG
jgi:hypothetical protein